MAVPSTAYAEELQPCPDPWVVVQALSHLPHLLFLDSSECHADRGRFSYIMAAPSSASLDFDQLELQQKCNTMPELPPFQGGYAGLWSYELSRRFERLPLPQCDEFQIPESRVFRYDWVVSFDHHQRRAWIVASSTDQPTNREMVRRVRSLMEASGSVLTVQSQRAIAEARLARQHPLPGFPEVTSNFSRSGYLSAVQRAIDYIHAGDCFQVNLSQRLLTPLRESPLHLYSRLRQVSPAPFSCYFDLGEFQILSASPERFLQVHGDGEIVTRPIKGTRPRGQTKSEDDLLLQDLVQNPKDRAENVMIVDLLRNDIGRVAEFGSVCVPRVCEVESYPYVHHLVSEVRGKLQTGRSAVDLLKFAFPGGSVTGAPKVRAMEIIAELEPTARGAYCGCIGFIGFDGVMDTNILIRTFTAGRGWLQFPVGGGVVADSDPRREYEETLHKAAGMLKALSSRSKEACGKL